MKLPEPVVKAAQNSKYKLLFATVSGAHLYGFPSENSDYDLRGVHILPVEAVVGLELSDETVEISEVRDGIELDLVTHDVKKFFSLMLKKNGYVLEQLYSPIIVHAHEAHDELKDIGKRCITKHHSHHYFGFADKQWKMFSEQKPPRVKPLLYVYRVLLTGINLMRTGAIEANLVVLNEQFKLGFISDLIARKTGGEEYQELKNADMDFHSQEFRRLMQQLEEAYQGSSLPEAPTAAPELDQLLKRLRLQTVKARS